MEEDALLQPTHVALCTDASTVPLPCADGVPVLPQTQTHKPRHRVSLEFTKNPSVAVHVVVLLAAVFWLATGLDFFLVLVASLLIVMLCCLPQVLWCRIVDWVALALVVVVLVYRDHSAIFEDVMLVVFRVHHNATAARL